jgi:hypothetical protein
MSFSRIFSAVMPGLVPGIHVFSSWMAGPSPAMTDGKLSAVVPDGRG